MTSLKHHFQLAVLSLDLLSDMFSGHRLTSEHEIILLRGMK